MSGWKVPLLFLSFSLASLQIARCTPAIVPRSTGRSTNDIMQDIQNDCEKQIIEQCRKYGGPNAFDDLKAATKEAETCLNNLIDVEEVKKEAEKAKSTGNFEPVFSNICKKSPGVKACIRKGLIAVEGCLNKSDKLVVENMENVLEAFMDFLCFQNGNNVILFFKEGGAECFADRGEAIAYGCVNSTLGKYQKTRNDPEKTLFLFGEEQCLDIYATQECAVDEMMKCNKPTPAKVFEEMFNFINRRTSCNRVPKIMKETSSIRLTASDNMAAQSEVPSPVGLVLSQLMTPLNATHMQMDLKLLMPRV